MPWETSPWGWLGGGLSDWLCRFIGRPSVSRNERLFIPEVQSIHLYWKVHSIQFTVALQMFEVVCNQSESDVSINEENPDAVGRAL